MNRSEVKGATESSVVFVAGILIEDRSYAERVIGGNELNAPDSYTLFFRDFGDDLFISSRSFKR